MVFGCLWHLSQEFWGSCTCSRLLSGETTQVSHSCLALDLQMPVSMMVTNCFTEACRRSTAWSKTNTLGHSWNLW